MTLFAIRYPECNHIESASRQLQSFPALGCRNLGNVFSRTIDGDKYLIHAVNTQRLA